MSGRWCRTSQTVHFIRPGQCFPLVFRAPACCIKRVIVFTGSVSDRTGAAWISGPMTYSVLSFAGCVRRALNSSPFVWHLTQVKSVFPPTVCLECLPLEYKRVYISVGAIKGGSCYFLLLQKAITVFFFMVLFFIFVIGVIICLLSWSLFYPHFYLLLVCGFDCVSFFPSSFHCCG